ncbi:hypothetical protein LCGC14_3014550, partial [marine sediment metagenome]
MGSVFTTALSMFPSNTKTMFITATGNLFAANNALGYVGAHFTTVISPRLGPVDTSAPKLNPPSSGIGAVITLYAISTAYCTIFWGTSKAISS